MTAVPRFPRIILDVPPVQADEVAYELVEMGANGVEQRDDTTLAGASSDKVVTLLASFSSETLAEDILSRLDPSWNPRRDDVVGDEWRDSWKEHFKPFYLTPSIVVCPPWSKLADMSAEHVIVMDPGRAFGTGLHATTRLVADAIERHAALISQREMLDVGCGSGVLCLCALVHGARVVRATDNDPEAVSATIENARRNGFSERIVVDTAEVDEVGSTYPFVVANIEARVLVPMAEALKRRLKPGSVLVLSGILREQEEDVLQAYSGLCHESTREDGGWISLELRAAS